jgi:Cu2+-containing amine oxidase
VGVSRSLGTSLGAAKSSHPLDPLSPAEIAVAIATVRAAVSAAATNPDVSSYES